MKNNTKKFITTAKLAEQLGISRIAVFKKIQKGEIEAKKGPRGYLIDVSGVPENGKYLTDMGKKTIQKATDKIIKEYGETLKMLAKE